MPGVTLKKDIESGEIFAYELLTTGTDAARRNGALAVKLAENACQRTQYKDTVPVLTLAAAYAEAGRFDDAVTTAQKACALASKAGDLKLLQSNEALLNLFLQHQPYREPERPPEGENRPQITASGIGVGTARPQGISIQMRGFFPADRSFEMVADHFDFEP